VKNSLKISENSFHNNYIIIKFKYTFKNYFYYIIVVLGVHFDM
jgi:hypothetical protein